jgi:segregation and condensation protein A
MADGNQAADRQRPDPPLTQGAGDPAGAARAAPAQAGVGTEAGVAAPASRCNPPAIPMLHLDGFDGPMDLLLDLAQRQRIDLGRLSVLALAEQFVAAMAGLADRVALQQRADWLVMAARLVHLRSRLLFPASPAAAAEAARDAAAALQRIDALARMRLAASWLQARPQLGQVALIEACLVALRGRAGRPPSAPVYRPAIPVLWRVADALARIRVLLAAQPEGGDLLSFLPAIAVDAIDRPLQARAAVASTFMASLELARARQLRLEQGDAFGVVTLHPLRNQADSDAPTP